MSTYRGVLVGAGGFGGVWAHRLLPAFRDRMEIVGLADIDPLALQRAAAALDVPASGYHATAEQLFAAVEADVCFLVIPPAARSEVVRLGARHGTAILCEKPVAASWAQSLEIAGLVRESGIPFAVVQNYRQTNRIRALKQVLRRPELGAVNLLQCRFAVDYTIETAGGAFRHQFPDAFIYEGAEHHIDQFRNLLDADGDWVMGTQWNQPWSTFANNTCVALIAGMSSGAIVQYEMNHIDRGHQNGWHDEFYRVACEGGTVTLDADHIVRITRHIAGGEETEEIAPADDPREGHDAVITQFLDWLDGGPAPVTVLDDNLRTMALTFAAVQATRTGRRIDVAASFAPPPTVASPALAASDGHARGGLHAGDPGSREQAGLGPVERLRHR